MSREELKQVLQPLLQQALEMGPEAREATLSVVASAIAAADGLPALREIFARVVAAAERRIGTRVAG